MATVHLHDEPDRFYRVEVCRACPLRSSAVATVVPLIAHDVHGLTRRELDVVRLLPDGISNAEIARRLHVSAPTVKARLTSALGKLELRNRTEAAVWAVRSGLVA